MLDINGNMSKLFSAANRRSDKLKHLDYIKPVTIEDGKISGLQNVKTSTLDSGPISINSFGDVTGVRTLKASGIIETGASLKMKEFSSTGRIQTEGPLMVLSNGYYDFSSVGSTDADYGRTFLRHMVYIWGFWKRNGRFLYSIRYFFQLDR
jgi:hypothetical protein